MSEYSGSVVSVVEGLSLPGAYRNKEYEVKTESLFFLSIRMNCRCSSGSLNVLTNFVILINGKRKHRMVLV